MEKWMEKWKRDETLRMRAAYKILKQIKADKKLMIGGRSS
jgi:hypothetical protein